MFKEIIFLMALFLYSASPLAVYANNLLNIKEPLIKPNGDMFYQIKRGYEKILEKFQLSDKSKLNYHQNLLLTRLSELKYVAERKNLTELQKSTERFSYEAGKITELSVKPDSKDKTGIKDRFKEYKPVLEKLRDLYPANSSYWMLIQYDIDTLDILSQKLIK